MPKPVKKLGTLAESRAQAARDAKRTSRKPSNDPMIHSRQIMADHIGKVEATMPGHDARARRYGAPRGHVQGAVVRAHERHR
jgi:hypothetical protein